MMITSFQALLLSLVLLVPVVYKAVSQVLVKRLRARLTALDDLPLLSDTRKEEYKISGTAVICGGRSGSESKPSGNVLTAVVH
jgi:hypothetical protein